MFAGHGGRAVRVVGLRSLASLDCGFEFHQVHECLSVVIVVLSGRGLCDGLITHPEESYRLWRVVECDLETSKTMRLKPATWL
jgi:hypothetical protein